MHSVDIIFTHWPWRAATVIGAFGAVYGADSVGAAATYCLFFEFIKYLYSDFTSSTDAAKQCQPLELVPLFIY